MTSVAAARAGVAQSAVAGLIGERWLRYLDSCWGRNEFSAGPGRALLEAPYARPNSIDRTTALELTALSVAWLTAQTTTGRAASMPPQRA
jgi:hypothetical protein